jgi:hypothetical protein
MKKKGFIDVEIVIKLQFIKLFSSLLTPETNKQACLSIPGQTFLGYYGISTHGMSHCIPST